MCFQEQKLFVLKIVLLTIGICMREGVNEGSICGNG